MVEQAQVTTIDDGGTGNSRSRKGLEDDMLETTSSSSRIPPPTFCRLALTRTLSDWPAVNSLIMNDKDTLCASFYTSKQTPEEKIQLESQKGSARLDKFTHTLLLKLNTTQYDYLGSLISTLSQRRRMTDDGMDGNAAVTTVAHRFVRSVVRVFVCFSGDLQPAALSNEKQAKYMERFTKVFRELMDVAIEELCLNADALMAPVRLGAVRPVAPFNFSADAKDALSTTDELFRMGPYAPKKQKTETTRGGRSGASGLAGISRNRTSSRVSQRNRHHSSTPLGGGPPTASGRNTSSGWGLPFIARRQGSIRTAELGRTPIIIDANGDQLLSGHNIEQDDMDEDDEPPAIDEIPDGGELPAEDDDDDDDDEDPVVDDDEPMVEDINLTANEADLANLINQSDMDQAVGSVPQQMEQIAQDLIAGKSAHRSGLPGTEQIVSRFLSLSITFPFLEEEHNIDDDVEEEDEEEDEEEEDDTLDGQSNSDESNHSDEYHEENTYEIHDDPEFLAYTSIDEPFMSHVRRERQDRNNQFAMNWAVRNHRPTREHRRYRQWLRFN